MSEQIGQLGELGGLGVDVGAHLVDELLRAGAAANDLGPEHQPASEDLKVLLGLLDQPEMR